jgi:hypothetical protein
MNESQRERLLREAREVEASPLDWLDALRRHTREAREEGQGFSRRPSDDPRHEGWDEEDEGGGGRWLEDAVIIEGTVGRDDAMVVEPESMARLEDHGPDAPLVAEAQRFLAENDPLRTIEGVTAAIEEAAAAHDLNLKRCRAAVPKSRGRHSDVMREHRAMVREALLPVHERGATHALMAETLECTTKAVEALLKP